MKQLPISLKYKKYKRYIQKFNRIFAVDPKSTKLDWLKKRILKLKSCLIQFVHNNRLRAKKYVTVGCITLAASSALLAQNFEYQPTTNHPFEDVNIFGGSFEPKFIDFDGDGDEDLFLSTYTDPEYATTINGESFFYFENDAGSFKEKALGNIPDNLGLPNGLGEGGRLSFDIIDFDGDGDADLFAGDIDGGSIHYLENTDGSFSVNDAANPFDNLVFEGASFFEIGDLDGDGEFEAVVSSYGQIEIYSRDGDVFEKTDEIVDEVDEAQFASLALHDFDGDGDLDIVVGNKYGDLRVYENIAASFTLLEEHSLLGFNRNSQIVPAFSDIDGDGSADLVVGTGNGALKYHRKVAEAYEYVPYNDIGIDFHGGDFVVPNFADIDADGDEDIVVGSFVRGFAVLENTEAGYELDLDKFQVAFDAELIDLVSHPECADFDNDGDIDCLVSSDYGAGVIPLENVDGQFIIQDSLTSPFYDLKPDDEGKSYTFDDFDSDGDLDLLIANKYGELSYFENNNGSYTEASFPLPADAEYYDPIFADLDRDGDNDLLVRGIYGGFDYYVKEGQDLIKSDLELFPEVDGIYRVAFFDHDKDGDLDALISTSSGNALYFQNTDLSSSNDNINVASSYEVFPNPANNFIQITLPKIDQSTSVALLDINGKVLFQVEKLSHTTKIDLGSYASGNYLIQIIQNEKVSSEKIVIVK